MINKFFGKTYLFAIGDAIATGAFTGYAFIRVALFMTFHIVPLLHLSDFPEMGRQERGCPM